MSNRRKLKPRTQSNIATQQAMRQVLAGLQAWNEEIRMRKQSRAAALHEWPGGQDPVPAEVPEWPEGSLGDRFFSAMRIDQTSTAPRLAAGIPPARVVAADPAQWNVAIAALIRAVLLDGVSVDDPAVITLLGVLAPVAEAENAYQQAANLTAFGTGWIADEPEFPEQDGPLFLLGTSALIDAIAAVIWDDPLEEILGVLTPLLSEALPELDGQLVADALVRAYSHHYRCDRPGDEQVLERLVTAGPGAPLEDLISSKVIAPEDALRVGLTVLAALGNLCRSASASVLKVAV
jgi:hypothetical protein